MSSIITQTIGTIAPLISPTQGIQSQTDQRKPSGELQRDQLALASQTAANQLTLERKDSQTGVQTPSRVEGAYGSRQTKKKTPDTETEEAQEGNQNPVHNTKGKVSFFA